MPEPTARDFCARCRDETIPESAGDVRTFNGSGFDFAGSARECPECKSTVQVLWRMLVNFPLTSQGTFRRIDLGDGRFLSRRLAVEDVGLVRKTRLQQSLLVLAIGAVVALLIYLKG